MTEKNMPNLSSSEALFEADQWFKAGRGPRYLQFCRHVAAAITSGRLEPGTQLPAERELARIADISRVTVRKAVAQLAEDGLIEQRHGAGSFVRVNGGPKLKQSLSWLVSFSELMQARGLKSSSTVLDRGLFTPTPDELVSLGLGTMDRVCRIKRLRSADGTPIALEASSLPEDILPNPEQVETSLYQVLRAAGKAPTRAIQRVQAINLGTQDARLFNMPEGSAVLRIDRTAYLATGRPIEFTRGLYRSDIYDFVTELRLDGPA